MTPEEFYNLPVALQLRRLIEAYPQMAAKVMAGEAPRSPKPPKYDSRIRRKGGFMWASDCDAESLRFWCKRAHQPASKPEFAEKNAKEAKALDYFLEWRSWFPSERWSGERNRQQVTGDAPSSKPRVYEWEPRGGEAPRTETKFDDSDGGYPDESGGSSDDYF
jgi:hypothetical protein